MPKITIKQEKLCLLLLISANLCYVLAIFSHAWFKLPGVSYGLWWAIFCDYLSCQIIPAFFTEEPGIYFINHVEIRLSSFFFWYTVYHQSIDDCILLHAWTRILFTL